ncbi:uncharacterized protein LOC127610619 isoform X3 [Hippocampus zosterae]|uniref:uncharacterized protein LOC127610619 isoform X3 n=1 Tax=Hippocampus zosterae TaxID=109293 RepID=UPI00223E4AC8|nr:uncharacterized protein LOC127610619 isoform X3 [Hippocampus zosterae]
MDAALSDRQTLNEGGAEEQLAASPKPPKRLVIVSRCAGCYKQHKCGVKSAGSSEELDRSSSSSEDDDDDDEYEREGAPPAGGAHEQEGRRGERQSKTEDAETHPEAVPRRSSLTFRRCRDTWTPRPPSTYVAEDRHLPLCKYTDNQKPEISMTSAEVLSVEMALGGGRALWPRPPPKGFTSGWSTPWRGGRTVT